MTEDNLLVYILASIAVMLLFAVGVIWFLNQTQRKIVQSKLKEQEREISFQKELLENTVKTQESERERIAKELHDDVGSQLSVIHLNLHVLKEKVEKDQELHQVLDHIEQSLKKSTERTRTISHDLMPSILQKFGFLDAVNELVNSINLAQVLDVDIENESSLKISDKFKLLHLYRIIQELLNNTLKYANASKVKIVFTEIGEQIEMIYTDNGVGFDPSKHSEGLGLGNVNTRIRLLDGTIDWSSEKGDGVKITSKFPNHD